MEMGVHCMKCARHVVLDPATLHLAPETPVPSLAGRFRCTRCGSKQTEAPSSRKEYQRLIGRVRGQTPGTALVCDRPRYYTAGPRAASGRRTISGHAVERPLWHLRIFGSGFPDRFCGAWPEEPVCVTKAPDHICDTPPLPRSPLGCSEGKSFSTVFCERKGTTTGRLP